MFAAKYLLFALLALPFAELVVFILVVLSIGFWWALALVVATSLTGLCVLRLGGGSHIERAKVVLGPQRVTAIESDAGGVVTLLAGFLLLIPGFITDVAGLLLLIAPLRRWLGETLLRHVQRQAPRQNEVVDLAPEEWRQVPDGKLTDKRNEPNPGGG